MSPKTFLFSFLFLSFSVGAVRGAEPTSPPEEAAWDEALARLASVTADTYPDADDVSVYEWERTVYQPDGTYETSWRTLTKILTDRGLRDNRSTSFWNDDFYGSITVRTARVHAPDGTFRDIDLKTCLAEAIDTAQLSSNIHDPNDKKWVLSFPGVRIGDAIEIEAARTIRKPRMEGFYGDYLVFEGSSPTLWQGAEIVQPAERPFRSRMLRDAEAISLEHAAATNAETGAITERWIARDVPRYFAEPNMPAAHTCTARLLLSTAEGWPELSRWYARLCAPHLACTNADMAAKVAELAPADAPRADRIRALFDFVSREVRYMGVMAESEAPGYEPHDVSLTFANRYGVCRDKAALLVAMLRLAGIDAWPVLINVGPRKDPLVPQPFFNHAIVAADSGDPADPYLLMDPTNESTRSLLPEYLCEKSYLVARDEGETIRETAPLPVAGNLAKIQTECWFETNGTMEADSRIELDGINDANYRGYFAGLPRDGIRAWSERLLARTLPGAVLLDWKLSPEPEALRSSGDPLRIRLRYAVPEALRFRKDSGLFEVPCLADAVAVVNYLLGDLGLEKSRFPLETELPCGFEETIHFAFPDGVEFLPPGRELVETNGIRFLVESVDVPHVRIVKGDVPVGDADIHLVRMHRELKLLKSLYSPEEYGTLRMLRESEERAGRLPGLAHRTDGAAIDHAFGADLSRVVARAVKPEPTDDLYDERDELTIDLTEAPSAWTTTETVCRRILTYAGQKRAGDLTLWYNPLTCDLTVRDASIESPDGTVTPIDPQFDVFDGDQSWVASAPRYPAGRLRTVSFPKCGPGCTVRYTIERRFHDCDFFSFKRSLGSFGSFGTERVTVIGTNDVARAFRLDLPYWTTPAARFAVETNAVENGISYTVTGGGPGSSLVPDPSVPAAERLFPTLRASMQTPVGRAAEIRAAMWRLSDPATQTNAAAFARTLVPAEASAEERFLAIRDWSAQFVRTAGPAYSDLPLRCLTPADTTLRDRYGHRLDRRILELALARALGFEAEIRLYDSSWIGNPNPELHMGFADTFDGVAIVLRGADGREVGALDGSSQYADPRARAFENETYLTGLESNAAERKTEAPPADTPVTEYYYLEPRADGSARVTVERIYHGTAVEAVRKTYDEMLPEEFRRHVQRVVAGFAQSATLVGDYKVDRERESPGTIRVMYTMEIPDFAVVSGDRLVIRLPERTALSPALAERAYPFRRDGWTNVRRSWRIAPPKGYRVERMPESREIAGAGAFYKDSVERDDSWVVLNTDLRLEPLEFGPDEYADYLRETLSIRGPAQDTVILVPSGR